MGVSGIGVWHSWFFIYQNMKGILRIERGRFWNKINFVSQVISPAVKKLFFPLPRNFWRVLVRVAWRHYPKSLVYFAWGCWCATQRCQRRQGWGCLCYWWNVWLGFVFRGGFVRVAWRHFPKSLFYFAWGCWCATQRRQRQQGWGGLGYR